MAKVVIGSKETALRELREATVAASDRVREKKKGGKKKPVRKPKPGGYGH